MNVIKGCIRLSTLLIGIYALNGCMSYTKENGSKCQVDLFPTTLIYAAIWGTDRAFSCSSWTVEGAASRAQIAANQASDWADSAASNLRAAKTTYANGWSDQVADHVARAKRIARGTRDFANAAKEHAEWATTNAPNSESTKDVINFAQEANNSATLAEQVAREAELLL